jgi:hypothetical protein
VEPFEGVSAAGSVEEEVMAVEYVEGKRKERRLEFQGL